MLTEILERFFTRNTNSRQQVKDRLRLVLSHDRTALPPHLLALMQKEILDVVSRYVELETEAMEFLLENDQRSTILIANLPIRRLLHGSAEEETVVDAPNLQIPDLTLDEDGGEIAASNSDAEPTAFEEKVSPEVSPAADSPTIAPAAIAPDPDLSAELTNESLDLSNLDFSGDADSETPDSHFEPSANSDVA
jgi:cell division topological specificity factor